MPVSSHVVTRLWLGSNAACWLFGQNWDSEIADFAETLVLERNTKTPKVKEECCNSSWYICMYTMYTCFKCWVLDTLVNRFKP